MICIIVPVDGCPAGLLGEPRRHLLGEQLQTLPSHFGRQPTDQWMKHQYSSFLRPIDGLGRSQYAVDAAVRDVVERMQPVEHDRGGIALLPRSVRLSVVQDVVGDHRTGTFRVFSDMYVTRLASRHHDRRCRAFLRAFGAVVLVESGVVAVRQERQTEPNRTTCRGPAGSPDEQHGMWLRSRPGGHTDFDATALESLTGPSG